MLKDFFILLIVENLVQKPRHEIISRCHFSVIYGYFMAQTDGFEPSIGAPMEAPVLPLH